MHNGFRNMTDMTQGKYRTLAGNGKGGFETVFRSLDIALDRRTGNANSTTVRGPGTINRRGRLQPIQDARRHSGNLKAEELPQ